MKKIKAKAIQKKSGQKSAQEVIFALKSEPGCLIFVAGTFNDWNPTANPLCDNPDSGHYKACLRLPPGRYEYKFIANGEWIHDPNCLCSVENALGTLNSVIQV